MASHFKGAQSKSDPISRMASQHVAAELVNQTVNFLDISILVLQDGYVCQYSICNLRCKNNGNTDSLSPRSAVPLRS